MTLSTNAFAGRKDLDFTDLRKIAAEELMKKVKDWHPSNKELLQVMRGLVRDSTCNHLQ